MTGDETRGEAEEAGLWLPTVMQEPVSNVIATDPEGFSIVLCHCEEGPYYGARKMGTPCRCERCGFMVREQWEALTAARDRARDAEVRRVVERVRPPAWTVPADLLGGQVGDWVEVIRLDELRKALAEIEEGSP